MNRYGLGIVLLSLTVAGLLSGCPEPAKKISPDRGSTSLGARNYIPGFEWRIVSDAELNQIHSTSTGINDHAVGFVGYDHGTKQQVIYTTQPKRVDDEVACTLGHEVMHIALGNYHR